MNKSLFILSWLALAAVTAAEEPVSYEKDVKPLIAKYCLRCHSGDRPKGGLSLDGFSTVASLRAEGFRLDQVLDSWEQRYIDAALRMSDGNLSEAARVLGVNRTTLYSKIQRLSKERF